MKRLSLKYSVRSKYRHGESLPGYVYRFLSNNGHRVPPALQALVKEISEAPLSGGNLQIVGAKVEQLRRDLGAGAEVDSAWSLYVDTADIRNTTGAERMRYCPVCVGEHEIHLAIWSIRDVSTCPLHGCKLWSVCRKCQYPLYWSNLLPDWQCRCCSDLRTRQIHPASPPSQNLTKLIIDPIAILLPGSSQYPVIQVPDSTWEDVQSTRRRLDAAVEIRWRMTRSWGDSSWRLGLKRRDQIHKTRHVPHAWESRVLKSWPTSFQSALIRLARRYWSGTTSLFVTAAHDSIIADIIAWLELLDRPPSGICEAFQPILDAYQLPIETSALVFFNPRYEASECIRRLNVFWPWWLAIAPKTERDPLKYGRTSNQQTSPCGPLVLSTLSLLIDAANRGVDPLHYRKALLVLYRADKRIARAQDVFELINLLLALSWHQTQEWLTTLIQSRGVRA